jgi:hypothetical protein
MARRDATDSTGYLLDHTHDDVPHTTGGYLHVVLVQRAAGGSRCTGNVYFVQQC